MPDGQAQELGGWNRLMLQGADLGAATEALKKAGVRFRNEVEAGPGGKQIQLLDPDGNPLEFFEPAHWVFPEALLRSPSIPQRNVLASAWPARRGTRSHARCVAL
jgi:hypothetical protein